MLVVNKKRIIIRSHPRQEISAGSSLELLSSPQKQTSYNVTRNGERERLEIIVPKKFRKKSLPVLC